MSAIVTEELITLANRLADAARPVVRQYFRTPLDVDTKGDDSPVTIADREVERQMREILEQEVPEHGIIGEEHGQIRTDADYVWVLDPIDGTKAFITGKPTFGTLISLFYQRKPVLGIIDQAITDERWLGVAGRQTTHNGNAIKTRACAAPEQGVFFTTDPGLFDAQSMPAYQRVLQACRQPMYGCDCYAYGLVALGLADMVVEIGLKPYDYGALAPVVIGAGGCFTDWAGHEITLDSAGDVAATGDPACHGKLLELLR